MARKRKIGVEPWKYVFIGYRGKLMDDTDFAGGVNLQENERLYLSLITDPPYTEGREHIEVLNSAMKTGHAFSRKFYYDGKAFIEL